MLRALWVIAWWHMAAVAAHGVESFTEQFSTPAGWKDALLADVSIAPTGGHDGSSYAFTDFSFAAGGGAGGTTAVLFRGHDEYQASQLAFVGNWMADGVVQLSAWVWHDAPQPLNFFTRIASPFNFPGATAVEFAPVPPRVWSEISFDIQPTSPQFVTFEGADFGAVFGNVGHVQFGVEIPAALADELAAYRFGLDDVTVTVMPEPAALWGFGLIGGGAIMGRRRRRSQPGGIR